ncbi:angiopoietin-related protein 6 isoform X2 [Chanos chanos]|uniref:Angiopoietin-related protein 6 isoform X2 n=1 Tax=Chanos chanos TaxID=29144 RepID=A0A6J2WK02_CHACN|nr:angiopoietin-related protein 6 isoform X2 [Chanos chanos]
MITQKTKVFALLMILALLMTGVKGRREGYRAEGSQSDAAQKRASRSSEPKSGRCSYTFIVPQQKLKGALCVSTETARANHSEIAGLRAELSRQQELLERLRGKLEHEGSLVSEVRVLRRESSSMNARITQLYAQLLNEIIQKKDQALEQRRLDGLLLNATQQVLQVSSSYRELEKKYEANGSHNESAEPKSVVNDVQRDQSAPLPQEKATEEIPEPFTASHNSATDTPFISYPVTKTPGPWRDCQHVLDSGESTSGIYLLRPQNANRLLQAWCEQSQAQGGWTVIQRRQDGSVNFFRTWDQYKQGFGNLDGEYWLGLEHLYWLTAQAQYKLRVSMEDWQGRQVFAEYDSFHLEPESDWYRLRLGNYHGNAGDSLSWHNNKAFTTLDRDKDAYSGNCAHYQKGGWWYHMCAHSNLNGVWYRGGHYRSRYQDGVYWAEFHGGSYSLKKVTMMIKPI